MVFREVSVIEIREVLRAWLAGKSERAVAAHALTAQPYPAAPRQASPPAHSLATTAVIIPFAPGSLSAYQGT